MEIPTLITFARNDVLLFFENSLVFRLLSLVFLLYLRNDTVQTTVFKEDKGGVVFCLGIAFVASVGGSKLYYPLCRTTSATACKRTV